MQLAKFLRKSAHIRVEVLARGIHFFFIFMFFAATKQLTFPEIFTLLHLSSLFLLSSTLSNTSLTIQPTLYLQTPVCVTQ